MDIIERLDQDHVSITRVVDVLAEQLELLKRDESPDYLLMLDVADYMHNYPDLIHHPVEDVIYKRYIKDNDDDIAQIMRNLINEHTLLSHKTNMVYAMIEGVLEDTPQEKEKLVSDIHEFIEMQRNHIVIEESKLFPDLRIYLSKQDQSEIWAELPFKKDLLIESTAQQYNSLYSRIVRS